MFLSVENNQQHASTLSSGYVKDIKDTLFSLTRNKMKEILTNVLAKQPKPLTSQFEDRISKQEAIEKHQARSLIETIPHPPGEINVLSVWIISIQVCVLCHCQIEPYSSRTYYLIHSIRIKDKTYAHIRMFTVSEVKSSLLENYFEKPHESPKHYTSLLLQACSKTSYQHIH